MSGGMEEAAKRLKSQEPIRPEVPEEVAEVEELSGRDVEYTAGMILKETPTRKVWLDKVVYKEFYKGNPRLSLKEVYESYRLALDLPKNDLLVEVYSLNKTPDKVTVTMEYFEGGALGSDYWAKMTPSIRFLLKQGLINYDLSHLNFLQGSQGVRMIDLDNLIRLKDLPEAPLEAEWRLTWFGSRMIKLLKLL